MSTQQVEPATARPPAASDHFLELLEAFIHDHPPGCRCAGCRTRGDEADYAREDATTLSCNVRIGRDMLRSATIPLADEG